MEDKHRTDIEETIEYYDNNAMAFVESTLDVDVSELYKSFEKLLVPGARILDLGSGSGRDSRYFTHRGYDVIAIDPSPAMCKYTKMYAHVPVFNIKAEEMRFENEFDAVWACASLLHISRDKQKSVLMLIGKALKLGGVCYCSWKYGNEERNDCGRHFTDFNEYSLNNLIKSVAMYEVVDSWITDDARKDREQKWINVILKKVQSPSLNESKK